MLMLFTGAAAHADWVEMGDAGELVGSAQHVTTGGTLSLITGSLSTFTDVDLYRIRIDDFTVFSASTIGLATWDTQLFLFTDTGMGIAANDDVGAAGPVGETLRSRLPVGSALYSSLAAGEYLLAITRYNRDAISVGGLIFDNAPTTGVYGPGGPDAPGGASALTGWSGGTTATGPFDYGIALTGASMLTVVPLPPAAWAGIGGLGCAMGLTAIRRRRLR